jgi:hypothetical protein
VLEEIDPDLNIFALANGLDLLRDPGDRPARVLEWYREQMERRLVLTPSAEAPDTAVDVELHVEARVDGQRRLLSRGFLEATPPGELREALPRAVEACNALDKADVEREGTTR